MINLLRYTDDLEKSGFTPEQAKVAVKNWVELMNHNFVTKSDFDMSMKNIDLRFNQVDARFVALDTKMDNGFSRLDSKIDNLANELNTKMDNGFKEFKSEMDHRFAEVYSNFSNLEQKLTIKLGSLMIVGIGVIAALIKL